MSIGLHNQSLTYCRETCPDVDVAFRDFWTDLEPLLASSVKSDARSLVRDLVAKVKEVGTEKLRDALCSAISDMNDIEEERDELRDQVRDLESKIDDLENQVAKLERELSEVTP